MKLPAKKRRSKYNNRIVKDPVDGTFHSVAEHKRWKSLQLLERAGHIYDLKRQVPYDLVVNGQHIGIIIVDFTYRLSDRYWPVQAPTERDSFVAEDVKGGRATQTDAFRLKRRLLKALHGINLYITGEGV